MVTSLRAAQKQMTRRLLLEKALETFEAKGYVATRIDDIASAAGTTRTTFYMHFPSKANLMQELVSEVDEIFVSADEPSLREVVESGARHHIYDYLVRKANQWPATKPYIVAANQAASVEPEIAARREEWFDATIAEMHRGLDAADRFDASTRHIRCMLAFGQLEFLSLRWFQRGWDVERERSLQVLTDAWCHLLSEPA